MPSQMIDLAGGGNPFALLPMSPGAVRRRARRTPAWQHPNRIQESDRRYLPTGERPPSAKKRKKKKSCLKTKKKAKKLSAKSMKRLKSMR
jgi:hypothetical protein